MVIALQGLSSGLDTATLIQQLLAGPRSIITRTQTQISTRKTAQNGFKDINARLASLLSRTRDLTSANLQLKKATTDTASGSPAIVNVSPGAGAAVGSFTVRVDALATATTRTASAASGQAVSQNVALAQAGFATTVTDGTFSVNGTALTIDSSTVLSDGVDATGSNTILAKINNAGLGVTATISNDADGRANKLTLTAATAIQLGSGADTSNFLSAAKLLASPGTTTRTSTGNLGVLSTTAVLTSARLDGALGGATGSFTINGVSIAWDGATDTLNEIVSKVNSSTAGVSMSYDPTTDRFKLANKVTGSTAITLADTSGTLLAAMKLTAGTQSLGANAQYAIDGGATQYSTSNTVTDAVSGVTLSLVSQSATTVTVNVTNDLDAVTQKVQDWVSQFNSATSLIRTHTAVVAGGVSGPLAGDTGMNSILANLVSKVTSTVAGATGNYTALSQIGLTFGAPGAAIGSTTVLPFDSTKFKAALETEPASVVNMMTGSGDVGGFAGLMKDYLTGLTSSSGTLAGRVQEQDKQIRALNDQVTRLETSFGKRQELLEIKFQKMEQALSQLKAQQAQLTSLFG